LPNHGNKKGGAMPARCGTDSLPPISFPDWAEPVWPNK
jgi:hypothetical protein